MAGFDFEQSKVERALIQELATLDFTAQAHNVVFIGGTGTGKSHLATALGVSGITQHGKRVRFYSTVDLVNLLEQEKAAGKAAKLAFSLLRMDLVILDELGYLPFSPTGAQLLFQFCSTLHERVSLIITTNLPFSEWVQVLGDERLTAGLLDRVTAKSHILEFVGESYRFRQRKAIAAQMPDQPVAEEPVASSSALLA